MTLSGLHTPLPVISLRKHALALNGLRKRRLKHCVLQGVDIIRTHPLFQIVTALQPDALIEQYAKELDLYYISGRYPDAFPAGAPFEMFTGEQAGRALAAARDIITWVEKEIAA